MLIGNPDHFAIEIDWINLGESAADFLPAEAATWSSFKIFAGGRLLTQNVDSVGTYREQIYGSPLPIAIWALEHWKSLVTTETRPLKGRAESPFDYVEEVVSQLGGSEASDARAESVQQWWMSHNIRGEHTGLAVPDLFLWRQGSWMLLWWRPDDEHFAQYNVRFVPATGKIQVPVGDVIGFFADLFGVLEERLNSQGVADGEDWHAEEFRANYHSLTSDRGRLLGVLFESGLEPRLFAIAAGVDAARIDVVLQGRGPDNDLLRDVSQAFDLQMSRPTRVAVAESGVLALFRSAAPSLSEGDVHELRNLVHAARRGVEASTRLNELRNACYNYLAELPVRPLAPAYQFGQFRARAVRHALGISPTEPIDVERFLVDILDLPVAECELTDQSIDGVSLWSYSFGPLVAINAKSRMGSTGWGRRMALAHELCHLIFDSAAGRTLGIASGEWAPLVLEKIANAFAAEFLLPRTALEHWSGNLEEDSSFQELLGRYGVGVTVAARQARNHDFISESTANRYIRAYSAIAGE